jgi:hypothetical protein
MFLLTRGGTTHGAWMHTCAQGSEQHGVASHEVADSLSILHINLHIFDETYGP